MEIRHQVAGMRQLLRDFELRFGVPIPAPCAKYVLFTGLPYEVDNNLRDLLVHSRDSLRHLRVGSHYQQQELSMLIAKLDAMIADVNGPFKAW
jgi:hypothetical protein